MCSYIKCFGSSKKIGTVLVESVAVLGYLYCIDNWLRRQRGEEIQIVGVFFLGGWLFVSFLGLVTVSVATDLSH